MRKSLSIGSLGVGSFGALLGILVLAWLTAVPAGAATSPSRAALEAQGSLCSGSGVNVVVDFHQLGGGVQQACDPAGAGKTAWHVFEDAGIDLTESSAFAGAICKVDAKPSDTGCTKMPPADAYWSLYVDKNGKWVFASKGAAQLTMHDGDFVALSWQGSKKAAEPGVAPVAGSAANASPQASADAGQQADTDPADAADSVESDGGLSWWIPVAIVVVLLLGGVAVAAGRRRTSA